MPVTRPMPAGAPVWFDLSSSDTAKSRAFYEGVFGWTSTDSGPEYGGYVNFYKGDVQISGMMHNGGGQTPDGWMVYLKTDDAAATAAAVTEAGGTMMFEPLDVMGLGTMAIALDPTGAAVGIWQAKTMQGYGLEREAGTPAWHELHTLAYGAEVEFYQKAFGWTTEVMSDTPEFRYTLLKAGGDEYAGIMDGSGFYPAGAPSTWEIYIGVDDVDATLARVVELGGTIIAPAEDSAYGRMAKIADPTGGTIKLLSVPSAD